MLGAEDDFPRAETTRCLAALAKLWPEHVAKMQAEPFCGFRKFWPHPFRKLWPSSREETPSSVSIT
jgi:hypothetical protein